MDKVVAYKGVRMSKPCEEEIEFEHWLKEEGQHTLKASVKAGEWCFEEDLP